MVLLSIKPVESASVGANPEHTLGVFKNDIDNVVTEAVCALLMTVMVEFGCARRNQVRPAILGSQPDIPACVPQHGVDRIATDPVFVILIGAQSLKALVDRIVKDQSAVLSADPQGAMAIFGH